MILTSNLGIADWSKMSGDPVLATALLDRLLHHAVVITINCNSYRLDEHMDPGYGSYLKQDVIGTTGTEKKSPAENQERK